MVCSVRVECVSVSSFGEGLAVCGCCCRVLTATAVPSGLLQEGALKHTLAFSGISCYLLCVSTVCVCDVSCLVV